jgi:malonyl-CoA O-methyltransferase
MAKLGPDHRTGYKQVGVVEGYDGWAATYDQELNPLIILEEGVTLELIGDVRGQRVLDLGCGTGRYCVLLAQRGAQVVGVDPSPEMLAQARRKVRSTSEVELHLGSIDTLDLPGEHFDLIVFALVAGHLPELEPIFSRAVRLLKPAGRMVISDIHPYWPVSGHDYTEFFDRAGQEYRIPLYPHLFEEYWSLCQKFGLQVEAIREPKIEGSLIERLPALADYRGIPLAIILKLRKLSP